MMSNIAALTVFVGHRALHEENEQRIRVARHGTYDAFSIDVVLFPAKSAPCCLIFVEIGNTFFRLCESDRVGSILTKPVVMHMAIDAGNFGGFRDLPTGGVGLQQGTLFCMRN